MSISNTEYSYLYGPNAQFLDKDGHPLSAGWLEIRVSGTGNEYLSYSDWDGSQNPFRIPLNSQGRAVAIVKADEIYDLYVYNFIGNLEFSRLRVNAAGVSSSVVNGMVRTIVPDSDNVHVATKDVMPDGSMVIGVGVDETVYHGGTGIEVDPTTHEISIAGDNFDSSMMVAAGESNALSDLNTNIAAVKTVGTSVYLDSGVIKLAKNARYHVDAFIKFSAQIDLNTYQLEFTGNNNAKIVVPFNNTYAHEDVIQFSYDVVADGLEDATLYLHLNVATAPVTYTMLLHSIQVVRLPNVAAGNGSGLPDSTSEDAGKVLVVGASGGPEWKTLADALEVVDGFDAGSSQVLSNVQGGVQWGSGAANAGYIRVEVDKEYPGFDQILGNSRVKVQLVTQSDSNGYPVYDIIPKPGYEGQFDFDDLQYPSAWSQRSSAKFEIIEGFIPDGGFIVNFANPNAALDNIGTGLKSVNLIAEGSMKFTFDEHRMFALAFNGYSPRRFNIKCARGYGAIDFGDVFYRYGSQLTDIRSRFFNVSKISLEGFTTVSGLAMLGNSALTEFGLKPEQIALYRILPASHFVSGLGVLDNFFNGCSNLEGDFYKFYDYWKDYSGSHDGTFTNCGSNSPEGLAQLQRIPTSWGGLAE